MISLIQKLKKIEWKKKLLMLYHKIRSNETFFTILRSLPYIGRLVSSYRDESFITTLKEQKEHIKNNEKYVSKIRQIIVNGFVELKKVYLLEKNINDGGKIVQVFIYSFGFTAALKEIGISEHKKRAEGLKRDYPEYLESIGFVRTGGKAGLIFLIKKDMLIKKVKNLKRFRSFLESIFAEAREKELAKVEDVVNNCGNEKNKINLKERRDKLMPYHYIITESSLNKESFGKINNDKYIFTENQKSDNLNDNILFSNINVNAVLREYENENVQEGKKNIKDLIEEQLTSEFIISSTDIPSEEAKKYKDMKFSKLVKLYRDNEIESDSFKKEIKEYLKALNQVGINF